MAGNNADDSLTSTPDAHKGTSETAGSDNEIKRSSVQQSTPEEHAAHMHNRNDEPAQNIIGKHIAQRSRKGLPFTRPAQMRFSDPQKSHKWIRAIIDILNALIFIATCFGSLFILQWGVNADQGKTLIQTIELTLPDIFRTDPKAPSTIMLLNVLVIMVFYLLLLFLCNSLWISTGIIAAIAIVFGIANRIKIELRSEPVLPTDITLAFHNTKSVAGFIPKTSYRLIVYVICALVAGILLAILFAWFFGKAQPLHITSPLKRIGVQILAACVPALLLTVFISGTSSSDGWSRQLASKMGDIPMMWDASGDARENGVLYTFIRNSFTKVMDKPAGYSQQKMKSLARKYTDAAASINKTRASDMTNETVILILSESFSDPTRVPGLQLSEDPMPNLRAIEQSTTSGLFLSSGYGGGTANLEYQALTGLSTSNFDASLTSPYQQIVPNQTSPFTFNQMWNTSSGAGSVAFHPFSGGTYQRTSNYKKFQFQHFWTLDSDEPIKYQDRIGNSPYVDDEAAYKNVVTYLQNDKKKKQSFIQLATMQNHQPYTLGYYSNTISVTSSASKQDDTDSIETYAQGVKYTDAATKSFLDQLNALNRPVTVIWYGDHLPGIYTPEISNPANLLTLHETDYFIWSNAASGHQGTKLTNSAYTSPNYLLAQGAEQMDAKVSPYLAFLTQMREQIPAMEPAITSGNWADPHKGAPVYLDTSGKRITSLAKKQQELINDYKLITYDMTVGKNYLAKDGFLTAPSSKTASTSAQKSSAKKSASTQK